MSIPANELVESVLSLPQSDRADLALRLLQSLTPPGNEIPNEELSEQLRDRVKQYRAGNVASVSLKEARLAINETLSNRPNP